MSKPKRQVLELKGGEEIVINLYGEEEIVISREKGNRKQLVLTMPQWCNAWKGRRRADQKKNENREARTFRVVTG